MFWSALTLLVCLLTVSCAHEEPLPPVPPPVEDLSTWTLPELVQPPVPTAPQGVRRPDQPATKGEQVMPFTASATFHMPVAVGWPLDIMLEPGEQVRNIVGGDRRP